MCNGGNIHRNAYRLPGSYRLHNNKGGDGARGT